MVYERSPQLRRHERSHKNDRRYTCESCSKSYLRPEHLKEHIEIVHKNQKLACPYENCAARFTQKPSLIAHVKKHQDDPKALEQSRYRCVMEKCGQKFQSKRNLTQHVNREHHQTQVNLESELDLIALLSCVAAEDLKVTENEAKNELITVDASAITPVKAETTPNIISKSRKRRKIAKKSKTEFPNSTINMQDLV